ncbi:proteasome stabiliser-domain-containing protein [Catenaria anguillulae PL171]|uniref:Proteasome stabiliser-domain-containing protein n=1 Tax=Catenaria anguillulae PL171 TaxID=765915 RepID=A0A1Y2H7I2_9FUNG|nr:proteasome stabiliser-domain-containing protein [Catenaria anguillulae PL171]
MASNGIGNDLELVERVELRFALADTDTQLASAVDSFLVPLIGKLSSTTPGVQAKVMQLLSHINARIKAAPQIALPVKPLIVHLLAGANTATIARNFSVVYLELALDRASTNSKTDRAQFAPLLLAAIPAAIGSTDPAKHPLTLKLASLVARSATNALDFPPLSPAALAARDTLFAALATDAEWATIHDALAYALRQPSGLPNLTNGEQWSTAKRTLISLIHWWTPADKAAWARSYALFVGTCDPVAIVADHAETTWRKNKVDVEDARLVKAILGLYLAQPTEQETPTPATVAVKTKVLAWVVKSKTAANAFPELLKVVFDAMFGKGTTAKIQAGGVGFLQWVARSVCLYLPIRDLFAGADMTDTCRRINPFWTVLLPFWFPEL